jgi:hypothetical protein
VGFLCSLPLLCILAPIAIVVNIVLEQANAAIVIEDLGMFEGFKRGWEVAQNNAGAIFVMALILMIGGGTVGVIIAVPIILAAFPIMFGAMAGQAGAALWVGVACVVAYLPFIILLSGILTAYIQSAWTLTYMRLTAPKTEAPVFIEANA